MGQVQRGKQTLQKVLVLVSNITRPVVIEVTTVLAIRSLRLNESHRDGIC